MKTKEPRSHWDPKYQEEMASLTRPDPFFLSAYKQFIADWFPKAGVVLDLAGGLGRHALWLTSRGWRVSVVDISEVRSAGYVRRRFNSICHWISLR